ncbi:MAG: hypothetical protein AAGJ38_05025 [Planctomycetota bacterium]
MNGILKSDIKVDTKYRLTNGTTVIVASRFYCAVNGLPLIDQVTMRVCDSDGRVVPGSGTLEMSHGQLVELIDAQL